LAGPDGKTRYTLSAKERKKTLAEGGYTLRVEGADGLSVDTPEFTLKKGRKVTVRVRLEKAGVQKVGQFEYITNSIGMKFVKIPAGEFMRGADKDVDTEADDDEKPRRKVKISSYWCGVYEVTQGQYQKVMGTNPSAFKDGDDFPVDTVSWLDAKKFVENLNEMPEEKKAGRKYRLTTEAEWEYACRASVMVEDKYKRYHFGDTLTSKQANFNENLKRTCKVGSYPANAFGLHDMHGNVWEWCEDWYGEYPNKEETDPTGPKDGSSRVLRGGSWFNLARNCRSAYRFHNPPSLRGERQGFRVALSWPRASSPTVGDKVPPTSSLNASSEYRTNSIGMKFVKIPAGEFLRGADKDVDDDAEDDEKPRRKVKISSFWCGVYEVTQGQYQKLMRINPSWFRNDGRGRDTVAGMDTSEFPVEQVSWYDAKIFIGKLNEMPKEKQARREYRLLREAEWEYTCRGSIRGEDKYKKYHFGDTLTSKQANFNHNLRRTCTVGSYPANAFGVHDMHGNVWEWCEDSDGAYSYEQQTDPTGPSYGSHRVIRGGSWYGTASNCR
jgi:formylglycine-generating enzyme required for sulfatase activity